MKWPKFSNMKLLIFSILIFNNISYNCFSQDFSYESTQDKSLSKFQRIKFIETYLVDLSKNLNKMEEKISDEQKKGNEKFTSELSELKSKVKKIESDLKFLKESKNDPVDSEGKKEKKNWEALEKKFEKKLKEMEKEQEELKEKNTKLEEVIEKFRVEIESLKTPEKN